MENAKAGDVVLKAGQLKEYAADFGMLVVPENRGKKDSRLIHLPVLRLRSRREHPLEPVFTLEGGPGGTNIKPDYVRDWLLENHDVVIVGYRGVDGSVSLKCPEINAVLKTVADPLSPAGLKELGVAMTRAARRLRDEGIDLPEYDIINIVDDLEAARKALGYARINLSGASYGGAVAYTYCIRYPRSLHRNLMGEPAFPWDLGVTQPAEKYARYFRRGQVVFLKDIGHMDVGSLEPQAAHHLEKRFFLEGVADASRYRSVTEQARDFVPRPSFQELAQQMLAPK